jgi:transcriptional regulator with XRE-family HTH domain
MTQERLGDELGCASRTVMRWEQGRSRPPLHCLHALAERLRGDEPELAVEVLLGAGIAPVSVAAIPGDGPELRSDIEPALNEVPVASAAPVTTASDPRATKLAAESVVYAVAEAIDTSPRTAKAAVVAAFTRASELGIGLDAVLDALRDPS